MGMVHLGELLHMPTFVPVHTDPWAAQICATPRCSIWKRRAKRKLWEAKPWVIISHWGSKNPTRQILRRAVEMVASNPTQGCDKVNLPQVLL